MTGLPSYETERNIYAQYVGDRFPGDRLPETTDELRAVARGLGAPDSGDILLGRRMTEAGVKTFSAPPNIHDSHKVYYGIYLYLIGSDI
jgi:hypothetical protein